jgi:hypothetical protein
MALTLQTSPNAVTAVYNPIEFIWSTDVNLTTHPEMKLKVEVVVNGSTINGTGQYIDWITISGNKRFKFDASQALQSQVNQSDNYDTIAFGLSQIQTDIVANLYGIVEYSLIATEYYQNAAGVWTEFDDLTTSSFHANNTALAHGATNDIDDYLMESGQIRSFLTNVPDNIELRDSDEFHLSFLSNFSGQVFFISVLPYDKNGNELTRITYTGLSWAEGVQRGIVPVNNNFWNITLHGKIKISLYGLSNSLTLQAGNYDPADTGIVTMLEFNNLIYAGTNTGKLLVWDGISAWSLAAPTLAGSTSISELVELNSQLYGITQGNGNLLQWNGTNAWVSVAPQLAGSSALLCGAVYNGTIYAGSANAGKLLEWNGVNLWVEKAPQLGTETQIRSLVVYNNSLYAGTFPNGKLYVWNDVNAWVLKAPRLTDNYFRKLIVHNSKLYGATSPNEGSLYEWNDVDAWVEKAPKLANGSIYDMAVFANRLFAVSGSGQLLVWNDVDAWVERVSIYSSETAIWSIINYNNKIYCGTAVNGLLLSLENTRISEEKEFCLSQYGGDMITFLFLNRKGGIDSYIFKGEAIEDRREGKTRYQNDFKSLVITSEPNTTKVIYIPFESQNIRTWLKEMLDSPKVWLYDSGYNDIGLSYRRVRFDSQLDEGFEVRYIEKPENIQRG